MTQKAVTTESVLTTGNEPKSDTLTIGCSNAFEDIKQDGSATLWHWKGLGEGLNEQYLCSCIYEMLTAKELFIVAIQEEAVPIERERFEKYCTKVESY